MTNVNPFTGEVVNSTEVQVVPRTNKFDDMGFNLVADMTTAQAQFCSIVPKTDDEKASLFNMINDPDKRIADCINMTINAKNLYIEVVECTNEQTQEKTSCPRIVIIDDKGVSYQAVSVGIYSALKKVIQFYGTPDKWTKPIGLEVKQVTKGNRKMLTLNIAKNK